MTALVFMTSQTLDLKFVTKCVAISPDFGRRNSGQPFITGDRDLVLYEKKLFLNYRSSVSLITF